MKKFDGVVVGIGEKTAIVEVSRRVPHKLYKKLIKKSKRFKAGFEDLELTIGQRVKIKEVRPLSRDKHFWVEKISRREKKNDST